MGDIVLGTPWSGLTPPRLPNPAQMEQDIEAAVLTPYLKDAVYALDPQFNIVADGVTDNTVGLQSLAAAVANTGKLVIFGPGQYTIATGTINWEGCHLHGIGAFDIKPSDVTDGSVIRITYAGGVAFSIGGGTTISGLKFYHPDQVLTDPPTPYPATIQFRHAVGDQSTANRIYDNCFINSYIAIDLNEQLGPPAFNAGVPWIANNYICAIHRGIISQYTSSEQHFVNNSFSYTFWQASAQQPVRSYIDNNAIAIQIGDGAGSTLAGITMSGNAVFGFFKGIEISGLATICRITDGFLDGCRHGIDIVDQGGGTICISGMHFLAKEAGDGSPTAPTHMDCTGLRLRTTSGPIATRLAISGCQFNGTNGRHIDIEATVVNAQVRVIVSGCHFLDPGNFEIPHSQEYPCIRLWRGAAGSQGQVDLVLGDCMFERSQDVSASRSIGVRVDGARDVSIDNCHFRAMIHSVKIASGASGNGVNRIRVVNCTSQNGSGTNQQDLINFTTNSVGEVITDGCLWDQDSDASTPGIDHETVAAAGTMALPQSTLGEILVTGGGTINAITAQWRHRRVTLRFGASTTVNHAVGNVFLAGSAPQVFTQNSTLSLVCDKTNWYETGRSVL